MSREAALFVTFVTLTGLAGCRELPVARSGPPQERLVSRLIRSPEPALRAAILSAFVTSRDRLPEPFDRMTATELMPPRFQPDWLATTVDPGGFLDDYKGRPPAERARDLLIDDPIGDVYWRSEYESQGGSLRFRCGFIIHLIDRQTAGTEVQVFEVVPTVWVGEHWAMSAHGIGFGRYHDIRFVEPTTKDRTDVLSLIERVVGSEHLAGS